MIMGVTGYATCGKSEVARILHELYGFNVVSFADKLRSMAIAIDPYICIEEPSAHGTDGKFMRYSEVLKEHGYITAKKFPDFRRFLQRLGTEGVRDHIGHNAWVDALMSDIDRSFDNFAIPDVRFPNEAGAIRRRNGKIWKVVRPGISVDNGHESEQYVESMDCEATIMNNSTLEHLEAEVKNIMEGSPR